MKEFSKGIVITVDPNSTKTVTLIETPEARVVEVNYIYLHFPTGSNYNLQVHFKIGTLKRIPNEGYITGDNASITLFKRHTITPPQKLDIVITNTDTSNSHSVFVYVEWKELKQEEIEGVT